MIRYFYDCRIKAAYMAKYFDFKLTPDAWTEQYLTDPGCDFNFQHTSFQGRYFVHPDSLHLLEPQVGDCYQDRDWFLVRVVESESSSEQLTETLTRAREAFAHADNDCKIIMRNQMAFQWPLSDGL